VTAPPVNGTRVMNHEFSNFGRQLAGGSGIEELMEDLGNALASGGPDICMLGGGQPAHIPEVNALWRRRMEEILAEPGAMERVLANYDPPRGNPKFITALAARIFLGEPLHGHTVLAMAVAVVGLAISVAGSLQPGALAGMAVALIVVLCMSGNYVVVRHRRDIGMTPSIWLAGLISGLVALPFAHPETVTWEQLPWLFALSPGQLAVGLLLYMASLKRIPAAQASLLGLLELVLGPVWVWLFDGEKPDDLTLFGGVIVISAAAANVWLDSRRSTG